MTIVVICHRCPHRQDPCAGPCACRYESEPVDITRRVAEGCPAGYFQPGAVPVTITVTPNAGPGEVMRTVLVSLGFHYDGAELRCPNGETVKACGCEAMRQQMNRWGYLGCLRHRRELVQWFAGKAGECGIDIGTPGIMALLRAGLKQWRGG